jgi:hypothetical protein
MGSSIHERKPLARNFALCYRAVKTKAVKSKILTGFTSAAGSQNPEKTGL